MSHFNPIREVNIAGYQMGFLVLRVVNRTLKFEEVPSHVCNIAKGRTIRKLIGGAGGGYRRSTKKYSRKGKLNEKN